jgi:uncharacterized protein
MHPSVRVVLDTNVLLSALVFTSGRLAQLRHLWQTQAFQPVTTRQTMQELIRVLSYPRFNLNSAKQESLLADYLPYATVIELLKTKTMVDLPICRDPKDQMFLELAQCSGANFLVSGDEDLLILDDPAMQSFSFRILTPAHFLDQLA